MKVIAYQIPNNDPLVLAGLVPIGQVAFVIPASRDRRENETEDQQIARVIAKDVPAGATTKVIENTVVPANRGQRNNIRMRDL